MYEFKLENATEMPLQFQALVDGRQQRGILPPTDARYRFLHGANKAVYVCSDSPMLLIMLTSVTNPEAPGKVLQLNAEVANHITFLCDSPFTAGCPPLSLMMTAQRSFPREVCPGNLAPH